MKRATARLGIAGILMCSATTLYAGGIERSVLNISPLFEDGRYLEFSFAHVSPELTGVGGLVPPTFGGPIPLTGETADILKSYSYFGAAYKADINDRFSYALILNQPYGADTDYGPVLAAAPDVSGVYGGSFADLNSYAITAILAYDATPNVKVYGGPVFQSIEAEAALPFIPTSAGPTPPGYAVTADQDWGTGFVLGAAYEKPEIALRVALTYRSKIEHDLSTTEVLGGGAVLTASTVTEIETPQSVTLDFQTGVAPKTAVFGQVNWVDWSEFDISPPTYPPLISAGRPLVNYTKDWWTYTLGVARRIDDNWLGAVSFTHEPQVKTELTSLGPVDGRTSINLGATYENERVKISGGVNYTWIGDASNVLATDYDDGTSIGFGFRIGFKL